MRDGGISRGSLLCTLYGIDILVTRISYEGGIGGCWSVRVREMARDDNLRSVSCPDLEAGASRAEERESRVQGPESKSRTCELRAAEA